MKEIPENPEQETAYYFDLLSGQLLIGQIAISAHIEAGGNPSDIRPLGELITNSEIKIGPHDYVRMDVSDWDDQDYINQICWINSVLTSMQIPQRIKQKTIERISYLGLGPTVGKIRWKHGSLSKLCEISGVINQKPKGLYDEWTQADFIAFIREAIAEHGPKGLYDKLTAISQQNKGPSPWIIKQRLGSLSNLAELAGYPDVKGWDYQDFIEWGIKLMLANSGRLPSVKILRYFSRRRQGPHDAVINEWFGGVLAYQDLVHDAYEAEIEKREYARHTKLQTIERGLEEGTLNHGLFEGINEAQRLIRIFAQFIVVDYLMPGLQYSEKKAIAILTNQGAFVRAILRIHPVLTAGTIEETALSLGVFDDIWPLDNYMQTLKLPPKLVA